MAVRKKAVDPWKTKQWYSLVAPNLFNKAEISQVPAQDPQHLLNRIIELPLKEITRELSHMYINVKLRVEEIKASRAFTKFIGHEIAREQLNALGRRNRSLLYSVFPCVSKDSVEFSVKVLIVTRGKASSSQRSALRAKLKEALLKKVESQDFASFIQEVLSGKASNEMHNVLKVVFPIKRIEIYKTQLKEVFDIEEQETKTEEKPAEPVPEPVGT